MNEKMNSRVWWISFPSPEERVLHLGTFVCFLFVGLSAQILGVFLCNHLSDWVEILTIGATTHVEHYNDNYDIIDDVV